MQLEIARPLALVLLPVLAGIIIWFSRGLRTRSRSRQAGEVALRCLVLTLAVLALAGVSIRKSSDMTTTVFLVDLSDSVKGAAGEEAAFVQSAIADMPSKNQAGIVVFGSDAQIEQFVSDKKVFTSFQSQVTATATNLEQAVQTAMALFPDGNARRLVILTDGAENAGSIGNLALTFAGSDVELKVMKYDSSVAEEVYVSNVRLPETIHQGDRFQVQVEIYSTEATGAKVSLYSGRTLKDQKEVILQRGNNQLVFSDQGVEGGLKSYRVTVEAEKDTVSVNNSYSAFTTVEARSKLLVVEGEKDESKAFVKVLEACNYDYDIVTPSGVPGQISDMTQYQSVVLLDVYADDLRKGFLDTIETYVQDYAGGLVVLGGPNSYALGNYRNTPLETVLPVKMDLEGEKQIPKLSMVMVIDHSGSMSSPSTARGNVSCMDVAKQAAINGLDSLREIDEVGVIAFDDTYTWAVPLQPATDLEGIAERIGGITAMGGTSIYPALAEAVDKLKGSDATLKHIVLLTDGQDGYRLYEPVLKDMEDNGITLSTVAVGTDADMGTLEWLAEEGHGRYYYSDAGTTLPRIFAQEVYLSAKSYLINEEFTPVIVNSHEIIENIFDGGSPSLLGYIAATPKPLSTVILQSHREDPVLCAWQYGLGRTVAWTSDGTNEWTRNFSGWDKYAGMWQNLIDWTISNTDLGNDTLQIRQEASSALITYETDDYTAGTSISAVITGENGKQQKVKLKPASPGVYQADIPLDETGVYSINVRNQDGETMVKNINTATAMQYSQEYRYADVSTSLDSFMNQVSGSRYIEKWQDVFDTELKGAMARTDLTNWLLVAAVLLFTLDVILRRMRVNWLGSIAEGLAVTAEKVRGSSRGWKSGRKVESGSVDRADHDSDQLADGQTGTAVNELFGRMADSRQKRQTDSIGNSVEGKSVNTVENVGRQGTANLEKETRRNQKADTAQKTISAEGASSDKKKGIYKNDTSDGIRKSGFGKNHRKTQNAGSDVIDTAALLKKKQERDL